MALFSSNLFSRTPSGSVGGGNWGTKLSGTIASGVLAVSAGKWYEVTSETGTSDALTQITGLNQGEKVKLTPASGHTITVTDGANLILQASQNFVMNNVDDTIILTCKSSGVCHEESRASAA